MTLYLRKLLSDLFLPLPIALALILIGLLLIWRFKKTGLMTAGLGWLLLFLFSLSPTAHWLNYTLEKRYRPITKAPRNVNTIVVLGGGVRVNPNLTPANTQLASSSLSRLVEGVRLYRLLKAKKSKPILILSGGSVFNSPNESGVMRNTAIMLGVPKSQLILESGSKNTLEEARYLKKTLRNKRFLLVTSANHMKRSIALFKSQGLKPIAAPTQYLARIHQSMPTRWLVPNAKNLTRNDLALHEYLGLVWSHINGEIKSG